MRSSEPARPSGRRIPTIFGAGLLAIVAAVFTALLTYQILEPSSSTAASPVEALRRDERGALGEAHGGANGTMTERSQPRTSGEPDALVPDGTVPLRREQRRALSKADGLVPHGTTVFDDGVPGVANLDSALLASLRQAATDAAANEIVLIVESGWRSAEYQYQLLREAVLTYGSEGEAVRWVATADTSPHVSGDAVDIGPWDAAAWLSEHGATYGLCQIYANQPGHYELRREATDHGCPPLYPDPTHDRRMHQ